MKEILQSLPHQIQLATDDGIFSRTRVYRRDDRIIIEDDDENMVILTDEGARRLQTWLTAWRSRNPREDEG